MNLYVGNLYYRINEDDLLRIFSEYGKVASVRIIRDPYTRRSKGYGFVEMEHDYEANRAVDNASGLLLEAAEKDPTKNVQELQDEARQAVKEFNQVRSDLKGPDKAGVSQGAIDDMLSQLGL